MNPAEFRLVVTSGPTREWVDPVRFLSNASSGRTGWHLASAGTGSFSSVSLITGPVCREYRNLPGALVTEVETTDDMADAVRANLRDRTLLIMAAAPADYTPATAATGKMKKSTAPLSLELRPTVDILASIADEGDRLDRCYRVGFAAETSDLKGHAREKLARKRLQFICGNEVYRTTRGFGERENTWLVYGADGSTETIGPDDKARLARRLLDHLVARLP